MLKALSFIKIISRDEAQNDTVNAPFFEQWTQTSKRPVIQNPDHRRCCDKNKPEILYNRDLCIDEKSNAMTCPTIIQDNLLFKVCGTTLWQIDNIFSHSFDHRIPSQ